MRNEPENRSRLPSCRPAAPSAHAADLTRPGTLYAVWSDGRFSGAVSADGTIGVFYYDFRFNTPDPATLPTTAFLVHSHDGGRSWVEDRLSAPFDLQTAPVTPAGLFIGDYQGLAARGRDFIVVFAITNGGKLDNRTDIVAVGANALTP